MRITFALVARVALFFGAIFVLESKSAIHQILAAITFLIFVVSAATTAILGAIAKLQHPAQPLATAEPSPAHEPPAKSAGIFPEPPPKNPGKWVKIAH
jgi:hypothetical protein